MTTLSYRDRAISDDDIANAIKPPKPISVSELINEIKNKRNGLRTTGKKTGYNRRQTKHLILFACMAREFGWQH